MLSSDWRTSEMGDAMCRKWWIDKISMVPEYSRNSRVTRGRFLALLSRTSALHGVEIATPKLDSQRALFNARATFLRSKCLYPTSLLNVFIYRGKQIRFDVLRCNAWAKINGLSTCQYMIMQSRVDQKVFKISHFKLFIFPCICTCIFHAL